MNTSRVDHIIQYALALASQSDERNERELGPIHFVKYVYLADLAFAQRNNESYTGVTWHFHNFGPWSYDVYQRLDSALDAIGAQKLIPMKFKDGEFARWSIFDSGLAEKLEKGLPLPVYGTVRKAVKAYANDTPSLLHHVYQTLPMLTTAPGEELNLFIKPPIEEEDEELEAVTSIEEEQISNNEKRRRKAKVTEIKARINEKIAERIKQKAKAKQACRPEYNEVFSRGVEWLDSLAGQPIEKFEGIAEIAPELWKSSARFEPDVS